MLRTERGGDSGCVGFSGWFCHAEEMYSVGGGGFGEGWGRSVRGGLSKATPFVLQVVRYGVMGLGDRGLEEGGAFRLVVSHRDGDGLGMIHINVCRGVIS